MICRSYHLSLAANSTLLCVYIYKDHHTVIRETRASRQQCEPLGKSLHYLSKRDHSL